MKACNAELRQSKQDLFKKCGVVKERNEASSILEKRICKIVVDVKATDETNDRKIESLGQLVITQSDTIGQMENNHEGLKDNNHNLVNSLEKQKNDAASFKETRRKEVEAQEATKATLDQTKPELSRKCDFLVEGVVIRACVRRSAVYLYIVVLD
jgi:hypothetical protein